MSVMKDYATSAPQAQTQRPITRGDILLAVIALAATLFVVSWYLNLPIVYQNFLTQECVTVELYDGSRITCDEFRRQYGDGARHRTIPVDHPDP